MTFQIKVMLFLFCKCVLQFVKRGWDGRGGMSPSQVTIGVRGSVRSSPSAVRDAAPVENRFWCILGLTEPTW